MRPIMNLTELLVKERYWSILILLYLVAWIVPTHWMKDLWGEHFSTLAAQPYILVGFAIILWGRREQHALAWSEIKRSATYSHKIKKGNGLTLLILGCILYFFAHFSRLAMVGIFGLVLMLLGMIVRIYGLSILNVIKAPCCYLLAIVPWLPESGTAQVGFLGLRVYSIIIPPLLLRFGKVVMVNQQDISVNGTIIANNPSLYGTQGVIAAIFFFWGYGLYKGYSGRKIISQVLVGCTVAFFVHLFRFTLVCLLMESYSSLARLLSGINCWLFTIPSIVFTLLLSRVNLQLKTPSWLLNLSQRAQKTRNAVQRPVDKALDGSIGIVGVIGKGIVLIFTPLTWIATQIWKVVGAGFGLLSQMNRNLEGRIRKVDRSREKRRMKK